MSLYHIFVEETAEDAIQEADELLLSLSKTYTRILATDQIDRLYQGAEEIKEKYAKEILLSLTTEFDRIENILMRNEPEDEAPSCKYLIGGEKADNEELTHIMRNILTNKEFNIVSDIQDSDTTFMPNERPSDKTKEPKGNDHLIKKDNKTKKNTSSRLREFFGRFLGCFGIA